MLKFFGLSLLMFLVLVITFLNISTIKSYIYLGFEECFNANYFVFSFFLFIVLAIIYFFGGNVEKQIINNRKKAYQIMFLGLIKIWISIYFVSLLFMVIYYVQNYSPPTLIMFIGTLFMVVVGVLTILPLVILNGVLSYPFIKKGIEKIILIENE